MRDGICPFCGGNFHPGATACPSCDLPLLSEHDAQEASVHDERVAARGSSLLAVTTRPRPEFSRGGLRRVAIAANQAEAEMVESVLRAEGIPCVVRRTSGSDVPDFLAAGRRDILVPEGGVAAARDLLRIDASEVLRQEQAGPVTSPLVLAAAIVAGLAFVIACAAAAAALT